MGSGLGGGSSSSAFGGGLSSLGGGFLEDSDYQEFGDDYKDSFAGQDGKKKSSKILIQGKKSSFAGQDDKNNSVEDSDSDLDEKGKKDEKATKPKKDDLFHDQKQFLAMMRGAILKKFDDFEREQNFI